MEREGLIHMDAASGLTESPDGIHSPVSESYLREFPKHAGLFAIRCAIPLRKKLRLRPGFLATLFLAAPTALVTLGVSNALYSLPYSPIFISILIGIVALLFTRGIRSETIEWRIEQFHPPFKRFGKRFIPASCVDAIEILHVRATWRSADPHEDNDNPPALQLFIRMGAGVRPVLVTTAEYMEERKKRNFKLRVIKHREGVLTDEIVEQIVTKGLEIAEWFGVPLIIDTALDSEEQTWWPHDRPIPGTNKPSTVKILVGRVERSEIPIE